MIKLILFYIATVVLSASIGLTTAVIYVSQGPQEPESFSVGAVVSSTALTDTMNRFRINTNDNFTRINDEITSSTFPLGAIFNLSTTTGNFIVASSSGGGWFIKAVGTDGQVLMASSTAASGVNWETARDTFLSRGVDTQLLFGLVGGGASSSRNITFNTSTLTLVLNATTTIGTSTAVTGAVLTVATTTNILTVLANGNIGIGTSSPQTTLEVVGEISAADGLAGAPSYTFGSETDMGFYRSAAGRLTFVVGGANQFHFQDTGINPVVGGGPLVDFTITGSASAPTYTFDSDTNTGMFRAGADLLGFTTAGSERIIIDSSGNVGIGTSTPTGLLHIMSGNTQIFFATSTGRIGIGTASPSQLFVVNDGATDRFTVGGAGFVVITANTGSDTFSISNNDAGANLFVIETSKFLIDGNGNVGIGTSTPTQLFVVGNNNQFTVSSAGAITADSIFGVASTTLQVGDFSLSISQPSSTTDGAFHKHQFRFPITLTEIWCLDNVGTSTINLNRRSSSTPNTVGTDMIGDLDCGEARSATTTFAIATSSIDEVINFQVTAAVGIGSTSTLTIGGFYTK